MIQWMLVIWSLVPLLFLNPVCTSGSSWFTYFRILAWRILNLTLLACEIIAKCVLNLPGSLFTEDFPGGSDGKASACNAGDLGLIPGLGRSPEEHGNPLQYSCLENPHGWRSLAGYGPWGRKESDMTERLSTHSTYTCETKIRIMNMPITPKNFYVPLCNRSLLCILLHLQAATGLHSVSTDVGIS